MGVKVTSQVLKSNLDLLVSIVNECQLEVLPHINFMK